MNNDDVLVELRAWRDEFARAHGYDMHAMVAALSELDSAAGQTVVRGEPRRPELATRAEAKEPNQSLQPTGAAISVSPGTQSLPTAPTAEL